MKKIFTAIAAALLITMLTCVAEESSVCAPGDEIFVSAKQALIYFDTGDYDSASALLGFADAEELGKFITGNFTTLGNGVQTTVAVAYWKGSVWCVAVPVLEPTGGDVETLVLLSDNGCDFNGYQYATWSVVESDYSVCDYVTWNEEYIPNTPFLVSED